MVWRSMVRCRLLPPALISAVAIAVASPGAAGAATTCRPPPYPGQGYFTALSTSGVSCSTGAAIARAYYRCRLRNGGVTGRCRGRVNNFTCREVRHAIPTEIDALVTCRRGRQTVIHAFQQNI